MICNVCGKEYQDGNAFCPYCGSKTAAPGSQPQMTYGASQGGQQYGAMQQGQGQQYTGQFQGQQFGGPGQGQQYGGPANGQQYGGQGQPQQFGGAGQPYGQPQFYNGPMQQEPPKKKKSHKGAIIAILLVIVLIGCGVGGFFGYKWYRNNCLENALADGEEQYADGNYDKAISFYKEALKYDEENKQALDGIKKSELGNALADAKALWMQKYRHILDLNDDGLPYDDGLPF
jgi:tetratricopeptide (TPR) repeat protein